jgi:hypothetical protein
MKAINLAGMFLLFGAVGCGGSDSVSPVEACNMQYATECARIYECYTAAQIAAAGLPATESACVTMSQTNAGCSAKTTANFCSTGTAVYHGEAVPGCVDQLNTLTCADVMSAQDITTVAPKCAEVCVIPA